MDSKGILYGEALTYYNRGRDLGIVNPQAIAQDGFGGKYLTIGEKQLLDLTRLDYLSLGSSKELKKLVRKSCTENNLGCPSSQIVLQTGPAVELEAAIADFHQTAESIVFLSGYCVNENILGALAMRMRTPYLLHYFKQMGVRDVESRQYPTHFFLDSESHYSAFNAARVAESQLKGFCKSTIFPCQDYDWLTDALDRSIDQEGGDVLRVIVTDSLSSTSGKVFDIGQLASIAEEYGCILYVDEAHSVGTIGEEGRGITSNLPNFTRYKDRIIVMGTLTKAFSQLGGYVAFADRAVGAFLRSCSPQYLFSAPLSPWLAKVMVGVIDLVKGKYGIKQRSSLDEISAYMRSALNCAGFDTLGSSSQIIPVLIGNQQVAELVKNYLDKAGFLASLFKYPAVPRNRAIIRFSLCSDVNTAEVDAVVAQLCQVREILKF